MKNLQNSLIAALVAATPSIGAETQECNTVDGGITLNVNSPDQLVVFEGCTALNGHIVIESDYKGDFVLNSVTEIHGNISTVEDGAEGLGLFELRDLVNIDNIHLLGLSGDVHLPKLERTGDIELVQIKDNGEAHLGSLVEASYVSIRGSWTRTNFESLKTVAGTAEFCGSRDCGLYDEKFPYIAVDLPSLKETDYFQLSGTVNSVSVPNLEVAGYPDQAALGRSQGLNLNIQPGGETLDFDAPKLHTLTGNLDLYGSVSGLSMGALGETNVGATINARAPLDIYSTIETARHFYLWQELHSVYLPNMKDLGNVALSYRPRLPCNDTLYQLWLTQPDSGSDWEDTNSCLDYEFPQHPATDQNSTSAAPTPTSTSTPTPSSSGNADSTSGGGSNSDANSDNTSQDSETSTESQGPGNGAPPVLSVPFGGAGLIMVGIVLNFL